METESDQEVRRRLDRAEGCLMWGLGVPGVVLMVAGMMLAIWGTESLGTADRWLRWGATVVVLAMVVGGVGVVVGKRRRRNGE